MGAAKNLLCGRTEEPDTQKGDYSWVREGEEIIGAYVRTRTGVKPMVVSPGHLIDLETAIQVILALCPRYRIPQVIRYAHQEAGRLLQEWKNGKAENI